MSPEGSAVSSVMIQNQVVLIPGDFYVFAPFSLYIWSGGERENLLTFPLSCISAHPLAGLVLVRV